MIKKLVATLSFILIFVTLSLSQKNDTLVHINGNIITGEIKKLEFGLLYFSTNGMGTIKVETDKIKSLKSNKQFQISLDNGLLYFGSIDLVDSDTNQVKIISKNLVYTIPTISLIEIFPIKSSFWLRTSGDFSVGGNYTKSSKILTFNSTGNLYYRGHKNYYQISWDNQITTHNDSILSEKKSNEVSYQRYFKKHYSAKTVLGASSNNELNLKSRIYINLMVGKDIVHTNRTVLYTGTGLSGNTEKKLENNDVTHNLEGIITSRYSFFKRTDPEINITTIVEAYPSFTVSRRWRVDGSIEARIEIFSDFYIGIKIYDNFDNSSGLDSDQHNDWGINSTISYSFH